MQDQIYGTQYGALRGGGYSGSRMSNIKRTAKWVAAAAIVGGVGYYVYDKYVEDMLFPTVSKTSVTSSNESAKSGSTNAETTQSNAKSATDAATAATEAACKASGTCGNQQNIGMIDTLMNWARNLKESAKDLAESTGIISSEVCSGSGCKTPADVNQQAAANHQELAKAAETAAAQHVAVAEQHKVAAAAAKTPEEQKAHTTAANNHAVAAQVQASAATAQKAAASVNASTAAVKDAVTNIPKPNPRPKPKPAPKPKVQPPPAAAAQVKPNNPPTLTINPPLGVAGGSGAIHPAAAKITVSP